MQDRDYTASSDFLKRLFGETLHKVELRACPNVKGEAGALSHFGAPDDAENFCRRKDVPGIGTYFGVCTRRDGAISGNLQSVMECPALWVDIDCVKQGLAGDDVIRALEYLPTPPTIIVNSGGGLHAYWVLEEAIDVSEGSQIRETMTTALRGLAAILAGDMKCAELARIMRLPGTMNSKAETLALYDGEPAICAVLSDNGRVHDFEALMDWMREQRAVLHGKVQELRPVREDDPFVQYARQAGFEPAIDIEAELAAMRSGDIHQTQLRVSMSMISRGYDDDEIVAVILAATERAAPVDAKWNWAAEEKAIRSMIRTGRAKAVDRPKSAAQPMVAGNNALKLVHSAEPETKADKKSDGNKDEITVLGTTTLAVWKDRYGPIMHSQGGSFMYEAGVWSAWDQRHDQMMQILLQEGCSKLKLKPTTSLINSALRFVMNHPDLLVRDVEFDTHELIIAEDGTLNLTSMEIGEHSPSLHAKFRVGASLQGSRDCPAFLDFLKGSFADRPVHEARAIISTLQEWFGASLVANKPRSLRKGLLVHGGSRTGKTQISEILRALLGKGQTTAIKVRDLEKDFGTETLLGKRGWVADDAVGQGETLDAETYKVLVTGEAMSVRRKNKSMIDGFRFACPVCLTMNNLPKIKDGSDAVYNRSLILPMTNVRDENAPEPAGYDSIAEKVITEELTGVLWWAIEGWQRLSARGVYMPPACMTDAVRALQEANDDIGTWASQCAEASSVTMVMPADLFASFAGWFFQEKGDTKFNWSQNGFSRVLKERMPRIGAFRETRARWITGIRLNEDGLEYWTVNAERDQMKRTSTKTVEVFAVNQLRRDVAAPEAGPTGRTRF